MPATAAFASGTVVHQRIAQCPMEGRGVVATRNGAELTIHLCCQSPHMAARQFGLVFDRPATSIRVLAKDVGGSFGQKTQAWREEIATIAATILTRHTLKWIEDRLESLTAAVQAREQEAAIRIAFGAGGRLLASHLDYARNNGAYPHMPDQNLPVAMFL